MSAYPHIDNARNKTHELQAKLNQAAKASSTRRFHALYDRIYRSDVLDSAWELVKRNHGAPGVDGISIEDIEAEGVQAFLGELQQDLLRHRYEPRPVRRVSIPKADGKLRHLGIPTVRDRVAQAAAKLVLEPIFEADFLDCSFGFRPRRSAHQANGRSTANATMAAPLVASAGSRAMTCRYANGLFAPASPAERGSAHEQSVRVLSAHEEGARPRRGRGRRGHWSRGRAIRSR